MNIRCCTAILMLACLVGTTAAEEVAPPSPAPGPDPAAASPETPPMAPPLDNATSPPVPETSAPAAVPSPPGPPAAPGPTFPGVPAPPRRFSPRSGAGADRTLQAAPGGGGFLVKFNNADIYEVIHTLGRIAEINYLIDPRVRGVVNVQTQGAVRKDAALDLLYSILRINGATAVLEGGLYHIVPLAESRMEPLAFPVPADADQAQPANRLVLRAFSLQFIPAADMAKVIKPFVTAGGDAIDVPRANMVLVVDTAANMDKHARLVELFDADAFRTVGVRLFTLKHLDPEEMAKNIDAVFGALDFSARGTHPAGINFVPIPRMHALLVVSASPRTMEEVERWIGELDKAPSSASAMVRLYRVKHGKAKDVMAIMEKLYPGKATPVGKETEFRPKVAEPARTSFPGVRIEAKPAEQKAQESAPAAIAGAGTEGGFDIILDEPMNALILRGSASQLAAIAETLNAIDVYPKQVLLEVLIGEVQLDDALKLGIDWSFKNASIGEFAVKGSLGTSAAAIGTAATAGQGLQYVMEKTDRLMGAFRSLASDGKVSILSAPSVIATNGKKSKIEVADSVPIVTASIVANSNPPVTTSTVEYKDVGVLLSFTPFINDLGTVTLEIEQEVSEVSDTTSSATDNPSFFKRNVQTTLVASEDRSIVLGGLVKERKSLNRDGIPFLYKIPVIGWLFGARSDVVTRTELLIFITPRVIGSVDEGTLLSREFEGRVEELKRRIGEAKGLRRDEKEPGISPGDGSTSPSPGLSPGAR